MDDVPVNQIGWGEITYDLDGVDSVHEAIDWAERTLASNEGPYSRSGTPVRDREYVLFAKVPNEDRYLQLAGWDPTVNAEPAPPYNLPRQQRSLPDFARPRVTFPNAGASERPRPRRVRDRAPMTSGRQWRMK